MAGSIRLLGYTALLNCARSPLVAVLITPAGLSLSSESGTNDWVSYLLALLPRFWLETSTLFSAKPGA